MKYSESPKTERVDYGKTVGRDSQRNEFSDSKSYEGETLEDKVNRLFDDSYEIERSLGGDGQSEIYVVHSTGVYPVKHILKIIKDIPGDDVDALDGVKALNSGFTSPYIAKVDEVRESGGEYYIIRDYIEGRPLTEWTGEEKRPSDEQLKRWMKQIANAVASLHDKGILHCDIKPNNIIITNNDDAILIDFDMAYDVKRKSNSLQYQTRPYASPQTVRKDPPTVQSDMYSYGAAFYHVAAGVMPTSLFGMKTEAIVDAINEMQSTIIKSEILYSCRMVINKCLNYWPSDRYKSFHEIENALKVPTSDDVVSDSAANQTQENEVIRKSSNSFLNKKRKAAVIEIVLVAAAGLIFLINRAVTRDVKLVDDLSLKNAACTVGDDGGHYINNLDLNIENSTHKPKKVSKKDWRRINKAISYTANLSKNGSYKNGDEILVKCRINDKSLIKHMDDKYHHRFILGKKSAKVRINGFKSYYVNGPEVKRENPELLKAIMLKTEHDGLNDSMYKPSGFHMYFAKGVSASSIKDTYVVAVIPYTYSIGGVSFENCYYSYYGGPLRTDTNVDDIEDDDVYGEMKNESGNANSFNEALYILQNSTFSSKTPYELQEIDISDLIGNR